MSENKDARTIIGDWIVDNDVVQRPGESVNIQADAIIAALSAHGLVIVPREPTDDVIIALVAQYEMDSHDPPAPNIARANAVLSFSTAPAMKERVRSAVRAAIAAATPPGEAR